MTPTQPPPPDEKTPMLEATAPPVRPKADTPSRPPAPAARPADVPLLRSRSALYAVVQASAVRYTRTTRRTSVIYDVNGGFEARDAAMEAPKGTHRRRDPGPTAGDGTNGIAAGTVVALDGTITAKDVDREDAALKSAPRRN